MAAGGSGVTRSRRGSTTGQGAEVRREGLAPLSLTELYVPAIDSLEEICDWLGTFRERLRLARSEDRPRVAAMVHELEARYNVRWAELS